jgi:hypothetical protein
MADVMADKSPNVVDQTPQCSAFVDELILLKAKECPGSATITI